ncbi:MAG: cation:proton antiporter, partial [Dehalococcoidia bacterium]
ILVVAKIGGEIFVRYLRLPAVIGELVGGVIIGPFALGDLIPVYNLGQLFEKPSEAVAIPVSSELFAFAQVAAIVLLFVVGLETNLKLFIKYISPASLVAVGGVVVPFFLGVYATILFDFADGFSDPKALFVGAAMTATSVGITARVLSERKKLDVPEGVTILAAAVLDDVLAILVLTVVVGVAETGEVSIIDVLDVGWKALAFLAVLLGGGIFLAKHISRLVLSLKVSGASVAIALALAFLAAGLAESFGLAMIIGAYAMGLSLSNTELAKTLEAPISAVYNALVPIFFVVLGMMVDLTAFSDAIVFGIVLSILAIFGKVLGSGLPAMAVGFNKIGAVRIGFGMLPRGEVALIIAQVGLAAGVIGRDIFGVVILMTIVTTLLAPIILVPAFERGGLGTRS